MEFVCSQIDDAWAVRYKKMFGENLVYVNERPLFLVCDNVVYVKELDCVNALLHDAEKGFPYTGAKEHYILDIDNSELVHAVIQELVKVIQIPKKKKS